MCSGLDGSELVYREIGQHLFWGREPGDDWRIRDAPETIAGDVQTRIVVDILSGTSAGGINAVFLAKALALKKRNLNNLKAMWLQDADIDTLLNDARSNLRDYPTTAPKASLLNSSRMYGLLLKALNDMDASGDQDQGGGARADQIDLFVTATDLNGLGAPIELTDGCADEKMHRMVFRFHSDEDTLGDFDSRFNRMLAFAARCTSSFPAAFEPMSFGSVDPKSEERERYEKFFDAYTCRDTDYEQRPFADGGILDNKPFSYAIDAIRYRQTTRPVDRKLLFIDPSPEHAAGGNGHPPNFVETAVASLVMLPGYQTIRGDIERINERNRYLTRLKTLRDRLNESPDSKRDEFWAKLPSRSVWHFERKSLDDMVTRYGAAYAPSHHIKVFGVTDWLARIVTSVMCFNRESDEYRATRQLVRAWREEHYAASPEPGTTKKTENQFLADFDMEYRLRRLHYIRERIDERLKHQRGAGNEEARTALKNCREKIQEVLQDLCDHSQTLESPERSPMAGMLRDKRFRISRKELLTILEPPSDKEQLDRAKALYKRVALMFEIAAPKLAEDLRAAFRDASHRALDALNHRKYPPNAQAQAEIEALRTNYHTFDWRDSVILPLLSGTGIEETGTVGIFRVSPADAVLREERTEGLPERKLAGVKLGHFGAFLSEQWRKNDIMWGRLDGAERIIAALLPDPGDKELREKLIGDAQADILKEELSSDVLMAWLAQYVKEKFVPYAPNVTEQVLNNAVQSLLLSQPKADPARVILRDLLAGGAGPEYKEFIRQFYRLPSDPDPQKVLEWTGRAATIVGDMFKGLKDSPATVSAVAEKLKALGVILTRTISFATPHSLGHILLHYWLHLLALASVLLILLGPFKSSEIAAAGWTVLGMTVALAIATQLLRDYLAGGSWRKRIFTMLGAGAAFVICFILGVGAFTIVNWFARHQDWFLDFTHKLG